MRKLRLTVFGLAMAGSAFALPSANAADVYSGGSKDPLYASAPLWNGFYFGAHVGEVWGNLDVTDPAGKTFSNDGSGALGGGTMGFNWQFGHVVYSAELDLGVADAGHSRLGSTIDEGVYGDITGRVGYAFDRTLLYAKGGFGFYNGNATIAVGGDVSPKSQSFTGWTLGAGIEYKLTPAWSLKAEYLHYDFGGEPVTLASGARYDNALTLDTIKAGVNYHVVDTYVPLK
jgi:outer membrane immunogenic protein